MKFFIAALALLTSSIAFAAKSEINVVPRNPVIIDSDFQKDTKTIRAPWFKSTFIVSTEQDIVIRSIKVHVALVNMIWPFNELQSKDFKINLPAPVALKAGDTYTVDEKYFGKLPEASHHIYFGYIEAEGWVGTLDNPVQRLNVRQDFVTQ